MKIIALFLTLLLPTVAWASCPVKSVNLGIQDGDYYLFTLLRCDASVSDYEELAIDLPEYVLFYPPKFREDVKEEYDYVSGQYYSDRKYLYQMTNKTTPSKLKYVYSGAYRLTTRQAIKILSNGGLENANLRLALSAAFRP
ncbi:hypothetical protein [Alteromonas gilva]|uniref:Uncharacterized protein n=1 Tax=Alteromonas gilva TaxID=2987522 RepID=A0ABT5L7A8_9ALTE|nr:hypothetical protein [Alteromonas gilva]MDC8832947.1 hypothetical protein [Alteromonas gilva]